MLNPAFDEDRNDGTAGANSTTGVDATTLADGGDGGPDESGESESGLDEGTDSADTSDTTYTGDGTDTDGATDPTLLEVTASFSACRGTGNYSPAQCAFFAGGGQIKAIAIDQASDAGDYLVACMTFPIDDTLVGKTITQVRLQMHTIDKPWAGSDAAGEIWAVKPFTPAQFDDALPPVIGPKPIAQNLGVGQIATPIHWVLPVDQITPSVTVYLCAYPLSADGIYFYSHAGASPPTLYIDYE